MELDIKQRGMDILADRIVGIIDLFSKKAPSLLVEAVKNGEMVLNKGMPEYLKANYDKCETIRTLLKRDSPTLLEKVYQPHRFESNGKELTEAELHRSIGVDLKRTIVSGRAGNGKSVFLKKLFRESIESGATHYPIFFEFRNLASSEEKGLLNAIFKSISAYAEGFTQKQFEFGLRRGLFYLIIDALDEVPSHLRDSVTQEIAEISIKYPDCPLVITSRPSDEFIGWEGFHTAHLLPFNKKQCLSFIEKIDYHAEKKIEFLNFIRGDEYAKHQEFLSNPLLASMMLLTFDEYGDIPERKHVFYEKCFQVLLREHDSSKGKYRREFSSSLGYESLEEVFTYFCVFSYLDNLFTFNEAQVHAYISDALKAAGLEGDPAKICSDFVNSVTILQKDSGHFEFTHRSFQEFFFAKFAVKDRDLSLIEKVKEVRELSHTDGAVKMIADMDKTYFEREFILPAASSILKELKNIDIKACPDRIIGKFFARVGVKSDDSKTKNATSNRKQSDKLVVFYSVTHDDIEYPPRHVNLILLNIIAEYKLDIKQDAKPANLDNDEILKIFKASQIPTNKGELHFAINHQNRAKMVALNSGSYASILQQTLEAICCRIEKDLVFRRSKLSEKILSKSK